MCWKHLRPIIWKILGSTGQRQQNRKTDTESPRNLQNVSKLKQGHLDMIDGGLPPWVLRILAGGVGCVWDESIIGLQRSRTLRTKEEDWKSKSWGSTAVPLLLRDLGWWFSPSESDDLLAKEKTQEQLDYLNSEWAHTWGNEQLEGKDKDKHTQNWP